MKSLLKYTRNSYSLISNKIIFEGDTFSHRGNTWLVEKINPYTRTFVGLANISSYSGKPLVYRQTFKLANFSHMDIVRAEHH